MLRKFNHEQVFSDGMEVKNFSGNHRANVSGIGLTCKRHQIANFACVSLQINLEHTFLKKIIKMEKSGQLQNVKLEIGLQMQVWYTHH